MLLVPKPMLGFCGQISGIGEGAVPGGTAALGVRRGQQTEGVAALAWGGKVRTRMTEKQRKHFFATSHRRLPQVENPYAVIPSDVLAQLASERLLPTKEAYQARLNELMAERKQKEEANGS